VKTSGPIAVAAKAKASPKAPTKATAKPSAKPTGTAATPAPTAAGALAGIRLNAKERQAMLEHFATLVDSGVQIAPALAGMRSEAVDDRQSTVLAQLEQVVVAGMPLSAAMATMPRAFPPLLVQMVRAGEATGQLGDMLRRTVDSLEIEAGLRARLRSALLYPVIMLTMTVGVVVFLLTCIVPRFETMLRGKVLPGPTKVLLATGELLRNHGHWLALAATAAIAGAVWFLRTPRGRIVLDTLLLRLPGVAGLYRGGVLARCTRTFGLLLQAGVPVHQALEHTREVAGSHAFRTMWERAQHSVVNGGSVLDAVRGQDLCGSGFEQLVAAGEATATLDKVMQKVGARQTKDLERRIKDLLTILEPMMVLAMAAIVGFVALAIMMPIFRMSRGG